MTDIPFPYPVLGNNGDIVGNFETNIMTDFSIVGLYSLNCNFTLDNEYFEHLIKTQQAAYTVEIECGSTNYRNAFSTTYNTLNITLSDKDVRDTVDVRVYICATKDIPEYKPSGMNADIYGNDSFEIKSGEIIAIHPATMFQANPQFDSLNEPVRSFIKLKESATSTKEMRIDCNGDFIEIELPEEDYKLYRDIHASSPELIHSCIVFPVLVDVLNEVRKKDDSEYCSAVWFGKIVQICLDRQISTDDPIVAAQKLLGLPLSRTFNWRKKDQDK